MKIVFMNGGLANQTFQYIFFRYIQLESAHRSASGKGEHEPVVLDDLTFFTNSVHNGNELKRVFPLTRPAFLSDMFSDDVWQELMRLKREGKSMPQMLKDMQMDTIMLAETGNYKTFNPFDGEILRLEASDRYLPEQIFFDSHGKNIYYHGYWLNSGYLKAYRDVLLPELYVEPIQDERNLAYLGEIKSSNSFALHIRRTDMVTIGRGFDPEIYHGVIEDVLENYLDAAVFVFSDDLNWCRDNYHALGLDLPKRTVLVEGNEGINSFRDLQLMTYCRGIFVGNSSFSYLAALLNTDKEYMINLTNLDIVL